MNVDDGGLSGGNDGVYMEVEGITIPIFDYGRLGCAVDHLVWDESNAGQR